jgi:hypothetical protein
MRYETPIRARQPNMIFSAMVRGHQATAVLGKVNRQQAPNSGKRTGQSAVGCLLANATTWIRTGAALDMRQPAPRDWQAPRRCLLLSRPR